MGPTSHLSLGEFPRNSLFPSLQGGAGGTWDEGPGGMGWGYVVGPPNEPGVIPENVTSHLLLANQASNQAALAHFPQGRAVKARTHLVPTHLRTWQEGTGPTCSVPCLGGTQLAPSGVLQVLLWCGP